MSIVKNNFFRVSPTCTDADSIDFIAATGITDATIKAAVCTLVTSLKAASLWSKFIAIYPLVGGTATTNKYNLKDPRDLNAAYRLSYSGGLTHNSNGITGNGTNGTCDTFIASNVLALNSCHISTYSRTNSIGGSIDIGSAAFNDGIHHSPRYTGLGAFFRAFFAGAPSVANSDSRGLYLSTRTTSVLSKMYKNGVAIITSALVSNTRSATNIHLLSYGGASLYSDRNIAFATIGEGLNDLEAANMYTIIQSFQTELIRQV